MTVIEIFETLTCCSPSGVDKEILKVSSAIKSLKQEEVEFVRHNLTKEPQAFVDRKVINDYITEHGVGVLPITLVNNEIVKSKEYPTVADFSKWLGITIAEETPETGSKKCSCSCG